jgi:hypothetical protein
MGFLDWFRRKTPQEKTIAELAIDRNFADRVEDAFNILLNFEGSIINFLEDLEKNAKDKKDLRLRDAIEKHGFLVYTRYAGRVEDLDAERLAVQKFRASKWAAIRTEAEKTLEILTALRQMLKGQKADIAEEQALSVLLRDQFVKFKEAVSANIHSLWADLRKYPELIDTKLLDKKFEKLRWSLGSELDIINRIIEQLIVAERGVA